MRLVAGRLSPFAVVSHRGRVTGHDYATPVWAFGTGDGVVLALLYGAASDWVRNVLAAGRAESQNACGAQISPASVPAPRVEAGIHPDAAAVSARSVEGISVL